MMVLLGDLVTVTREIAGDLTLVNGRISGIVQNDNGDLRYFYIKGIDNAFYVSDGWTFDEDVEIDYEVEDD
jgi:hypothetical protein